MAPVFSLVLDEDVSADVALTYPELYQELLKVGYCTCTVYMYLVFTAGKIIIFQDIFHMDSY